MEANTVRDFFNTINLSLLPDNAASFISNDILKDKDLDLIAKDEPVFMQLEEFIKTKYPSALGIEDTEPIIEEEIIAEPINEPTIENVIQEVIQPSLKDELQSIIDGYETLLEIEDDEKIIKRLKLKIGILKDEISKMEDGGEVLLEKSVTDENMFEAGGKLAYIRKDILEEGLQVPVGDDYVGGNEGYEYKQDDDGVLYIKHNGEWKEAVGTDWDFNSEEENSNEEGNSQNIAMFTTSYGDDVIGFVSEQKGLGNFKEYNMVYYVLEDDMTGSFIVCSGILQDGIIVNGSEAVDDYFADKDAAINIAKKMAFEDNLKSREDDEDEFIPLKKIAPKNNSNVLVRTNIGRILKARYENFIGNEIFETKQELNEGEHVVAWTYDKDLTLLVGSKAIIIKNLEDHLGYNGEELTVVDTTEDNFLILRNEENGLSFMASEDELKFLN